MNARETLERRIDELCHENEKLRQDNAKLRGARDVWQENDAKLRELLAELYEEECDECDRWKYRDRMRELGILEREA